MNHRVRLIVTVLALLSQAATANSLLSGQRSLSAGFAGGTGLPERVLHFPPDQSVGEIALIDESYVVPEISREFHPGYVFAQANTWDRPGAKSASRPANVRSCTWEARA